MQRRRRVLPTRVVIVVVMMKWELGEGRRMRGQQNVHLAKVACPDQLADNEIPSSIVLLM